MTWTAQLFIIRRPNLQATIPAKMYNKMLAENVLKKPSITAVAITRPPVRNSKKPTMENMIVLVFCVFFLEINRESLDVSCCADFILVAFFEELFIIVPLGMK